MLFKFSAYGFLKNLRFFEPFLYLFFLENGLSFFQIGLLIGLREIFVNLMEVPTGAIADLTGRRRAMVFSFGSYIISFSIFYLTSSFALFAVAMILFAAGEAFRSGTHKSMIMEYLDSENREDEKVAYYGKTRSASRLGSALSALLAALIVYFVGNYNVVFLATIFPYVLDLALMFTYPRELDGMTRDKVQFKGLLKETVVHFKRSFRSIVHTPELAKILNNASIFDSIFKIGKDYLQPIIRAQALALPFLLFIRDVQSRTSILIGVVYFFIYMGSFVSSRSSSTVMSRIGDMPRALNLLLWINAGAFLLAGAMLNVNFRSLTISAFLVFYILYNLRKPMVVGFLGDRIEGEQRATILSVHSQLRSLFGMVLAPTFGLLADSFGLSSVFFCAFVFLLITGLFLSFSENGAKKR